MLLCGAGGFACRSKNDRNTALRALDLVDAALRDPFSGPGKPEPLRYVLAGCWSDDSGTPAPIPRDRRTNRFSSGEVSPPIRACPDTRDRFAFIWVLHAFHKKSAKGIKTPKHEVDLIGRRLKRLKEMLK
jgi:hypothetical protein